MKKILLILLIITIAVPVQVFGAARPREIPYDHALSRAITRNPSIVPLDRDTRAANARARDLLEEYLATVNADRTEAAAIYGQRLMALAERDRLQRERDRLRLNVELDLRRHLSAITEGSQNVEILENTLILQEMLAEQTELRHYHGMASEFELRDVQQTLEQTRLNLEMLNLSLESERQQLNRLIHQPITANIQIIYDKHDFLPIPEEADTDRFIQRLAAQDHNLLRWHEEVEIRRHEWQRQLEDPEVDNSYMRLQHQLAQLERDMAERQAELNIRNTLAEWDQLLEQELALQADLARAQSEYENMQNRLQAGLVTQIQVDFAALEKVSSEARLTRHGYNFWITRLRIEHPYMR